MAVGPYGALLDAVRGVRWPARRAVRGGAPGVHAARTRGIAPEFAEYRPYRQGDDPRRIDWKLLARSDRAFVRLAPDHAVLGTTLLVDATASMDYPPRSAASPAASSPDRGAAPGKWGLAVRLAVALAAVARASGDPVGLTIVSGEGVRRLPPRARAGVVGDIVRALEDATPAGSATLGSAVAGSASRLVVLTDCLGDLDTLHPALARHRAAGGEAHLLHVLAAAEVDPELEGGMLATDPEDASVRRPLVAATRDGYAERFGAWRAAVARRARRDGVRYLEVRDDVAAEVLVRRVVRPADVGAGTGAGVGA